MSELSEFDQLHKKIAANIRRVRDERKLTQEDLAGAAGLDRAYIGYIERVERRPSVETLARIAKALQIDLHELFIFN